MRQFIAALVLAAGSAAIFPADPAHVVEDVRLAPAPALDEQPGDRRSAIAYFAGGCFWGVEGVFAHVKGVRSAVSGYGGGAAEGRVSYGQVSSGRTGHAETVRIVYDPAQISYGTLLRIFFSVIADPTTLNYQGPDHGTQYRSALFPQSADQARVAQAYLAQLGASRLWADPIVTTIEPVNHFQPAEAYHQDFMERNPDNGYIRYWDAPKLAALRRLFPQLYKAAPSA